MIGLQRRLRDTYEDLKHPLEVQNIVVKAANPKPSPLSLK